MIGCLTSRHQIPTSYSIKRAILYIYLQKVSRNTAKRFRKTLKLSSLRPTKSFDNHLNPRKIHILSKNSFEFGTFYIGLIEFKNKTAVNKLTSNKVALTQGKALTKISGKQ